MLKTKGDVDAEFRRLSEIAQQAFDEYKASFARLEGPEYYERMRAAMSELQAFAREHAPDYASLPD